MRPETRNQKSEIRNQKSPVGRYALILASGFWLLASGFWLPASAAPIITDSRIKTFVYNPNEVFAVTTHYGYQSNIEFAEKETIDTVSVGDRVAWQIIPAGQRLFIRAMEENAHTNMTVVTNLRAYQFDLRSSSSDAVFGSEELTYVVRFYYPDAAGYPTLSSALSDFVPQPVTPVNVGYTPPPAYSPPPGYSNYTPPPAYSPPPAYPSYTPPPVYSAPVTNAPPPSVVTSTPSPVARTAYNYRYTYSGSSDAAPVKIYDDGASTYFRFPSHVTPKVSVITARGERLDVPVRLLPDNIVAVDIVAASFQIQQPAGQVTVYNESGGA